MAKKLCDFCLEEGKGIFNQPKQIDDTHFICRHCRKIIESYDLPVEYDLFQVLVTAEVRIREMIMNTWIERHQEEDLFSRYYPSCPIPLHPKEVAITVIKSSIVVDPSKIPTTVAVNNISQVTHKQIVNLETDEQGQKVEGLLVETNAALYFLSEHFVNCHRLSTIATDCLDETEVHVIEHGKMFSYEVPHADLFFMRHTFFHLLTIAKEEKKKNLIYLTSDNTMTLTPGIYRVPRNIKSGTYYIRPVDNGRLSIRDAAGRIQDGGKGRINLDDGSIVEVSGKYQFRYRDIEEDDHK